MEKPAVPLMFAGDLRRDPKGSVKVILKAFEAAGCSMRGTATSLGVGEQALFQWVRKLEELGQPIRRALSVVREKHSKEIHRRHVEHGKMGGRPKETSG